MRLIVSALIGIGLIIIILIIIFRAFASLGDTNQSSNDEAKQSGLVEQSDNDSTMRLTIQGQVNSDQAHRQIVISVSRSHVEFQVMQGYQGTVIDSETVNNNESAYATFLRSLDLAGFTKGDTDKSLQDERGYCPRGQRYVLEAKGDDLNTRFWSTTCGNTPNTSQAQVSLVVSLFQAQVPDYGTRTSNVAL